MTNQLNILDNGNGDFSVQKFGSNFDIDTGSIPEDIWDFGGVYPFPTAAAATTIESDNVADDSGGIGARTVKIEGLDLNFNFISETITLDGTTAVTLSNEYIRVFRAYNITVGSNGINVGIITIQHAATVIAQISANNGQTLMAVYTVPNNYAPMRLLRWYASVGRVIATAASLELRTRLFGEGWRVQSALETNSQGTGYFNHVFDVQNTYPPKTDIIVRCVNMSANNSQVSAGFDLKS